MFFTDENIIRSTPACFMNCLISLTLYSNEDITDVDTKTIISSASVTSLIVSTDGQRKGDVTVTRESCPCDV